MSGVKKALMRKFGPLPAVAWAGIGGVALYVIRRKKSGNPVVPQAVQNALPTGVTADSSSDGTSTDLQPLSPDPTSYTDNTSAYTDQTNYGSGGSAGGSGGGDNSTSDTSGSGGTTTTVTKSVLPVNVPPGVDLKKVLSKVKIPTTTAGKTPPRARKANAKPLPAAKSAARAANAGVAAVGKKVATTARPKTTTAPKTATAPRSTSTRTAPPKPPVKPAPKPAVKPAPKPIGLPINKVGIDRLPPVRKTTVSKPPLKKRT